MITSNGTERDATVIPMEQSVTERNVIPVEHGVMERNVLFYENWGKSFLLESSIMRTRNAHPVAHRPAMVPWVHIIANQYIHYGVVDNAHRPYHSEAVRIFPLYSGVRCALSPLP